jgi:hypothetical protein
VRTANELAPSTEADPPNRAPAQGALLHYQPPAPSLATTMPETGLGAPPVHVAPIPPIEIIGPPAPPAPPPYVPLDVTMSSAGGAAAAGTPAQPAPPAPAPPAPAAQGMTGKKTMIGVAMTDLIASPAPPPAAAPPPPATR